MDSTGIAVLVGGYRLALHLAVPMRVVNCRASVRRVLDISGVLPLLTSNQ